jgi:hypothetical protein
MTDIEAIRPQVLGAEGQNLPLPHTGNGGQEVGYLGPVIRPFNME